MKQFGFTIIAGTIVICLLCINKIQPAFTEETAAVNEEQGKTKLDLFK